MGLIYLGPAFPQLDFDSLSELPNLLDALEKNRILIFASSEEDIMYYLSSFELQFDIDLDSQIFPIDGFRDYTFAIIQSKS